MIKIMSCLSVGPRINETSENKTEDKGTLIYTAEVLPHGHLLLFFLNVILIDREKRQEKENPQETLLRSKPRETSNKQGCQV